MLERWRDIPGWVGYYQASDQGRVRSVDRIVSHARGGIHRLTGKILQPNSGNSSGYLAVNLCRGGIQWGMYVHQLVAFTWIGPCPSEQQVRHGPNGIFDNSVGNLCYGTPSEDGCDKRRDGTHCGKAVKRSDEKEFINMHVAAEETGCYATNICKVCKGKYKSAGGFGWEYIDVDPHMVTSKE